MADITTISLGAASAAVDARGAQLRSLKHMSYDVFLNAGKERKHDNVRVHGRVWNHWMREIGFQNVVVMITKSHAGIAKVWIVERFEGIEAVSILFGATIAA